MKKILVLFAVISLLFGCMYNDTTTEENETVTRDASDFWQNVKMGDSFTVSRTTNGTDTTYDYTGLNIDDSYLGKSNLYTTYYAYNTSNSKYIVSTVSIDAISSNVDSTWTMSEYENAVQGSSDSITVQSNIFTQTWTNTASIDFAPSSDAVELDFTYKPRSGASFRYYIEGDITNGSGTVKVVGYQHNVDGVSETNYN